MLEGLSRVGIDCTRCDQEPGLRECLGCGRPPSSEDDQTQTGWDADSRGRARSPARRYRENGQAFRDYGFGAVRRSWQWCPRWWWAYSQATVAGVATFEYVARVGRRGLSLVGEVPTQGLLELLDYRELLEAELRDRERQKAAEEMRKRGSKSR